jgi:cell wall-associated NlpC family hydrolase
MHAAPRYAGGQNVAAELARREAARHGGGAALERAIDGYIGVPYLWGGTTRKGMDCSALVRAVYREAYGIELPRTSMQMYRLGQSVPDRRWLKPGDLVFFRLSESGPGVSHVGVYVGDGRFAHASSSKGGSIALLTTPYFSRYYAGARRVLD